MDSIETRLRILGETTAEDFPVATIEAWCLEAADKIERLRADRDEAAKLIREYIDDDEPGILSLEMALEKLSPIDTRKE